MKTPLILCLLLFGYFLQVEAAPFSSNDGELLLQSCREAVELFDPKGNLGDYAALHTSMSEAMRAGYCIGVVKQYIQGSHSCDSKRNKNARWLEIATMLANVSMGRQALKKTSDTELLKRVYCDD